ncbi:MAG TPA: phospholipase D family protein [Deltaproteobacteria bacterium]|nr:phospholipase D family protein [Deltaproteobacteria bacterium]
MKVFFSPQGGVSKELSRLIKAAKRKIDLAAYAFSSKYLGNALATAQKRGIKIRVILDRDNADQTYNIDEWLAAQGIEVRFIQVENGCMHHKFVIIDGKTLMTGSYNFTNDSEYRNYEAALFTGSSILIKAFATEFERLWLLSSAQSLPALPSAKNPSPLRRCL